MCLSQICGMLALKLFLKLFIIFVFFSRRIGEIREAKTKLEEQKAETIVKIQEVEIYNIHIYI